MTIELSTLTFTNGADIVPASGVDQILNTGIVNTLAGNDILIGTSTSSDFNTVGINNYSGVINTGDGNDTLIGTSTGVFGYGIQNYNINDNSGIINTGAGKDTIIAIGPTYGIYNFKSIETGAGDDKITATGGDFGIVNAGIINTGDGADSIIAYGGFYGTGSVFLGDGKDYLKGFGSGNFNGGNGKDTLELTSGSYTVGISGTAVNFTNGSTIMNTSEFEKLQAGDITYNFASLTNGQTIFVA